MVERRLMNTRPLTWVLARRSETIELAVALLDLSGHDVHVAHDTASAWALFRKGGIPNRILWSNQLGGERWEVWRTAALRRLGALPIECLENEVELSFVRLQFQIRTRIKRTLDEWLAYGYVRLP